MLYNRQAILSKYRTVLKGLQSIHTILIEQTQRGVLKTNKNLLHTIDGFQKEELRRKLVNTQRKFILGTDDRKGNKGEMVLRKFRMLQRDGEGQ